MSEDTVSEVKDAHRGGAFPIVIVGHVDHGKSTLIGRLLHDTGSLPEGKLEQLEAIAAKRGSELEWSFVMDALQIERDHGITLDSAQIWFSTAHRRYVIIDAPGHQEFLRNMVTGAAAADAALLVVDVVQGVSEQTYRHAYLLSLLGIAQVAVVVNKLDLAGYDATRFQAVAEEARRYLEGLGLSAVAVIPVSARHGDNIARASANMGWYDGPTVVEALDALAARPAPDDLPLRLPVQDVYRYGDRRIVVGRVETGRLRVGDMLRFLPTGRVARVKSIETWNRPLPQLSVSASQSVAITLDEEIFVERGHLATAVSSKAELAHALAVRLFWLGRKPLVVGQRLELRLGTARADVVVERVERTIEIGAGGWTGTDQVEPNGIADVVLRSRSKLVFDVFAENPVVGRGVLADEGQVVAGFLVRGSEDGEQRRNVVSVAASVDAAERAQANGHHGGVLWLTGLSGAGKSTLAMRLLRQLFDRGRQAYVIDGDNLRLGLCRDLDFTADARRENVRRAAEVAKLFADAGMIVIVALISPYRSDREAARSIVGEHFQEVFVRADLETCQARDPKGLYVRAANGEIPEFTGVSAPYEEPLAPELVIDTDRDNIEQSVARLLRHVEARFDLVPRHRSREG